ncbi:MAG: hypothetical protein A4S09_13495 [Proteobacteria bacterium SG_bin7]|nr:MAG: hypothetical protein A4S09_13495 [Proteobacteria bacterium SG_bin7]
MKKYDHAKERKLSLTSIIKNTILIGDESGQEQAGTSNGNSIAERVIGCDRKDNGKRENQSGGNSPKDRFSTTQYQQDHAPKEYCEFGLSCKNGGKHRHGSGNESQARENMNDELDLLLSVSNL